MTAKPEFWDRIAEKYARQPIGDEAAYRRKLEMTQARLSPDMDVLEIGCGTGSTALEHAPHVRHILATDLSGKMIEIARGKAEAAGVENATFDQAALGDLTGQYDVVMAHSVIHLLEDRDVGLAKIRALLKPGGLLVSSTACIRDMVPMLRFVLPVMSLIGVWPKVAAFTGDQLKASMDRAGFRIVEEWLPKRKAALFLIAVRAD